MSKIDISDVVVLPVTERPHGDMYMREALMLMQLRQEMVYHGKTATRDAITELLKLLGWSEID